MVPMSEAQALENLVIAQAIVSGDKDGSGQENMCGSGFSSFGGARTSVAELADAQGCNPGRKGVGVRIPPLVRTE